MKKRPGRKISAEQNRIAAATLYAFYLTDDFDLLPAQVRVSIIQLCKYRWKKVHGTAALRKERDDP